MDTSDHWLQLLAEIADLLTGPIDDEAILDGVARIAVPSLADICIVDRVGDGGSRRTGVAAVDEAERSTLVRHLHAAGAEGPHLAVRTRDAGETLFIPEVTDASLEAAARNPEQLAFLRRLRPSSAIVVPIPAGDNVVGALTLVRRSSDRRYGRQELLLAQEIGRRIGCAVDRARVRRTAEEGESRYRLLFEHNPNAMWVFDAETLRFLAVNDAAVRRHGYSREEFLGMTILDIRPPEDVAAVREDVAGGGAGYSAPRLWRHLRKDGALIDVEIAAHDLTFLGRPARVVTVRDVTEEKRAADASRFLADAAVVLNGSLDYHATLQAVAHLAVPRIADWCIVHVVETEGDVRPIAVAHVDPEKVKWAQELSRRYPADPHAATGIPAVIRSGRSEIHPEISEQMIAAAARDEEHAALLRRLRLHSAMMVPLRARSGVLGAITLIAAESGRRYGAGDVAFAEDLAHRAALAIENARLYQASEADRRALRQYGERLENLWAIDQAILAAQSSAAIAAAALDGLAKVLPACDWSAIYTFDERTDEAVFLATRAPGQAATREQLRRPLRNLGLAMEPLSRGEIQRVDDFGALETVPPFLRRLEAIGLSTVVTAPLLVQGRLIGALSLGASTREALPDARVDIAREVASQIGVAIEQDRLRTALEGYAAELEERVRQRTAQLEAVNHELEAFSYSVSHDLRAPLRSIDGFSQALLEDYANHLDEQGADYLNRVRRATQRMGHLIDDLLTLSRITRAELRHETVDLTALGHDIVAELARTEPERRVRFEVEDGLVASGDRQLLRVALENLLGNAWKFTARRADAVVEFSTTERDGERVFVVRDNGAGFDMAYAAKLFTPFQRLHGINEFDGTGVGLATVQRIVRRHGGEVWAQAEVDRGATFSFILPSNP